MYLQKLSSLFLFFTFSIYSQVTTVPEKVKVCHEKICDYYDTKSEHNHKQATSKKELKEYREYLEGYYDSVTDYYRYFKKKKQILKGVRFYTDNDAFFFNNRDHEYTGGLRIEFITDFVGLKILSFRRDHEFLNYQAVFFGFELYTPNDLDIRDVDELNPLDRPFASFQYIGRSRNILRYDGTYRATSELKIGIIGGEVSRNFQRVIHRDILDSPNNNGWDFQIANGGRLGLQYSNTHEWQEKIATGNLYFNYGFNFGLGLEKNVLSSVFTLTNKNFFERNPHNAIKSKEVDFGSQKWWDQVKQTAFFEVKLQPEVVFYNTMLQGYPTTNRDFVFVDNSIEEIPVLEDINRLIGRFSFGFGFRNYDTNLLLEFYMQTPEYDYSWKDKFFHSYGRISFTFNI